MPLDVIERILKAGKVVPKPKYPGKFGPVHKKHLIRQFENAKRKEHETRAALAGTSKTMGAIVNRVPRNKEKFEDSGFAKTPPMPHWFNK